MLLPPLRVISYDGAAYRNQFNADKLSGESGLPKERYPAVTFRSIAKENGISLSC